MAEFRKLTLKSCFLTALFLMALVLFCGVVWAAEEETFELPSTGVELTDLNDPPSSSVELSETVEVIETKIISVKPAGKTVGLYERLDVDIVLFTQYDNPFDPDQIKVDAIITTPNGKELVLPCFFIKGPINDSQWGMRYAPMEIGKHSYHIQVEKGDEVIKSKSIKLKVKKSKRNGFLRLDPDSYFNFKFDSGKVYRGIGLNACWEAYMPHHKNQHYTYEYLFDQLSKNDGDFIRIWMSPWNLHLEWNRWSHASKGPNRYDLLMAQRIDEVVESAEKNGVYIMLCFDFPGVLQNKIDPYGLNMEWKNNPYNELNAGPVPMDKPFDFFTNEEAKKIYKKRLRYMVARWGYSPSIATWEFWNEIEWVLRDWNKRYPDQQLDLNILTRWYQEMAPYLKSIDPYKHLVSTSGIDVDIIDYWGIDELDYSQHHWYAPTDAFPLWIDTYEKKYKKPHVVGESGYDWHGPHWKGAQKYYEMEFHLAYWYGLFSLIPILPLPWWWEFHINRGDLEYMKAASKFNQVMLKGDPLLEKLATEAGEGLDSLGVKADDKMYVWAVNSGFGSDKVKVNGTPKPIRTNVTVLDVADGLYKVKFYDTLKGKWTLEAKVKAKDGKLSIMMPVIEAHAACAISKVK